MRSVKNLFVHNAEFIVSSNAHNEVRLRMELIIRDTASLDADMWSWLTRAPVAIVEMHPDGEEFDVATELLQAVGR